MSSEKKILIIDDEEDLCMLLKDYFQRKNYEVSVSHTLKDGQQLLKEICPDILFLDNNLPDGIGWNLAPFIASAYPASYIVLISAFHPSLPEMPSNARYRAIEKPITMSDLDVQFANL